MFFSTPPLIAEMQTYLLMVLGMQAMILPPLILAFERMRLRTEPERDRRSIRDQFRTRGKFSRVGSRPTGSLELADAFELPT